MDLSAFDLKGRVALITGGAHGIGFSIAEGMAKCGAAICFNCSSEASLEKGMAAYKAAGIDAHGYAADVSDEDAVNAMVAKIKAEVGPVDILVNNAAVMVRTPLLEIEPAQWDKIMNTNLRGAFFCAQAAARLMMRQGGGVIVNTSSNAARMPIYGAGVYAMAKGGMNTMTMALAGELAPYNIRVNGYMPGLIVTEQSMSSKDAANEAERLKPVALRRYGTVEEMADVVLFLASPMSSYMTGETVTANGGKLAIQNPWKGWESK